MKLLSVKRNDSWRVGVINKDSPELVDIYSASIGVVDDVISSGGIKEGVQPEETIKLSDAEIGAPISRFHKNVLCVGWNYWDHFEESKGKREGQDPVDRPEHPTFFTKSPRSVIGPQAEIECDFTMSEQWDYEAEVAIIIGKAGKDISEEDAMDHVFGYTLANDVSVRNVQRQHGGQWFKGKSIDNTMPLGPWITTKDEISDIGNIQLECVLNGETLQSAKMTQMAFSIPAIIAELSRGMTLDVGDVVLTGTPSGIGNAREPKIFLRSGDVLITRATGLGELENRIS